MFKKLSVLMLLAATMVAKAEEFKGLDKCLSRDKDYYNSDEMVYRRKHKCGCEQFCCINTATLTVSGLANFNGASLNVRNQLNLNGVNLNNLFGIAGSAGINDGSAAVGLVDADGAATNSGGAVGLGLTTFANYYSTSTADIVNNEPIPFASNGPVSATGITRSSVGTADTNFVLSAVGTYEVTFFGNYIPVGLGVNVQVSLYTSNDNGANFNLVPQGVFTGLFDNGDDANTKLLGTALVSTTVANTLIQVRNTSTVDLTPSLNGGANPGIAGVVIKRIA